MSAQSPSRCSSTAAEHGWCLVHGLQANEKLLDEDRKVVGQLPGGDAAKDNDGLIQLLCQQTVDAGHSVLVFAAFKAVPHAITASSPDAYFQPAYAAP